VKGNKVIFDLNGLDFTFEGFYVAVTDEFLFIMVKDEAPMNLINLLGAVKEDVEVNRKDVLSADTVRFRLRLNEDIFQSLKESIVKINDIREAFEIQAEGQYLLKDFNNYLLEMYGTMQEIDEDEQGY
jgi:hypothetical protein